MLLDQLTNKSLLFGFQSSLKMTYLISGDHVALWFVIIWQENLKYYKLFSAEWTNLSYQTLGHCKGFEARESIRASNLISDLPAVRCAAILWRKILKYDE